MKLSLRLCLVFENFEGKCERKKIENKRLNKEKVKENEK